jgi:mitochondrial fission protein ELM1
MEKSTSGRPVVWVLADSRIGNTNQAVGVAEALGLPFEVKTIEYERSARLPNVVRAKSLLGITPDSRRGLTPPWPDVVITAGRRTAPVARYIKHQNRGRTLITQIMWPGPPVDDLDIIAVPSHDAVKPRPNVIFTLGAPHRVTPERLAESAREWRERLGDLPRPIIGVLVGGNTGKKIFDPAMAMQLGHQAAQMARTAGGSLLLTTSRRTTTEARNALMRVVDVPAYIHIWQRAGENPYFGLLALSDVIIVTGDSTSMCSEACATACPVYIFAPPERTALNHRRFHDKLYRAGYARPLTGEFATWTHPPLNAAGVIAEAIRERIAPSAIRTDSHGTTD